MNEPYRGPVKVRYIRDYSNGSIRDPVLKAQTYEELLEVKRIVNQATELSSGTRRKLEKLIRRQEIALPNRPTLLIPA